MTDQEVIDLFATLFDKACEDETHETIDDKLYSAIYDKIYMMYCDVAKSFPQRYLILNNKYRFIEGYKYGRDLRKKRNADGFRGSDKETQPITQDYYIRSCKPSPKG